MAGPLKGIRVLDLTRVLAGPFATQILADLGAEVIKVERPGSGDDTRGWGPPFVKDRQGRDTSESTYFASCNRGKHSVTADISAADGQNLVRRMAAQCDVLVENYKVGDLKRHGLDYETLHALLPRLIYCSVTGYGQSGPYADRAGYDPIAQAMCGLMSVTGEPEEAPGTAPQRVGVAVVDLMAGHYAVIAILAALLHRKETGEGQHIDIGLLDVGVGSMANIASAYLGAGVVARRNGGVHPSVVPSQVFRASDGWLILAAGNDSQFVKLCAAAGHPEVSRDARFATNSARVRNRQALVEILETWFTRHSVSHWVRALTDAGVPCGPIYTMDQVFADPQVKARGMRIELSHPTAGRIAMVASPIKMSATPLEYALAPPLLGQHDHFLDPAGMQGNAKP
jgi:crotonobetainyl-CoA:carnitine CoA-transferase CaiB-like acyl-CoA transferase